MLELLSELYKIMKIKKTIPTSAVMESISIALDMELEIMIDNNKIPLADI